ncbi:MAG: hypothetical protein JOY62_16230 [Acidobacteriaceae bacterium]|nr:hypothetical protein [Acidobacteriaceae bacterium]MBV9781511.1 hypothetical protein [Acidobacteriaceae bacterium]
MLIQECQKAILKSASTNPSMEEMQEAIRRTLRKLFREHELPDNAAQFLVAAWTSNDGLRLLSTREGIVIERDRHYCNGSGAYLANYLIEAAYRHDMNLREAIILATYTFASVRTYEEGCGGESEFITLRSDGSLSPVAHSEIRLPEKYLTRFEARTRKLMFDFVNPTLSNGDFHRKLDSFVEQIKIGREAWIEHRKMGWQFRNS